MTIEDTLATLSECRKLIPGPVHPADAAAADYLMGRLRGDYAGGTVIIIGPSRSSGLDHDGPVAVFHHGSKPFTDIVW